MLSCPTLTTKFFQLLPLASNQLFGAYDSRLVLMSYLVAVFASYIALDMTARLRDRNNTQVTSLLWLIGGSIAMGAGIWSMHFIGMLSFSIPGLTLQYDLFWTGISLLVAIVASGFALFLLKSSIFNVIHLVAGGVILGLAIASMHYTGMEGMLITLNIRYLPGLFLLSILIAIVASEAAICLAINSTRVIQKLRTRMKVISALIMGFAICGMHYTGMAASVFTPLCTTTLSKNGSLDPTILAMTIAAVTFVILCVAFFASTYKEASNQQQFERARQLGMAEISASVLHNVGNVLNSVVVSANTIAETNASSKFSSLEKLSNLLNEHKKDLPVFLTEDPRGSKVLDFLSSLVKYQKKENELISDEIHSLMNKVNLITEIISTQQSLSKTSSFENIISINELIDEAILITGLDLKKEISVRRKYDSINSIVTDKVKLLQVLVNLIRNAKDALNASNIHDKYISIKSVILNKNKIVISISDNGVGIASKNLDKIFNYGFTTKESGHGFGLHSSALAVSELGGEIRVKSDGHGKGATILVELPYNRPK